MKQYALVTACVLGVGSLFADAGSSSSKNTMQNNKMQNKQMQQDQMPMTHRYGYVQTGYAWSMNAHTSNGDADEWVQTVQGMTGRIDNAPFFTMGVGKRWGTWVDVDMTYTYYEPFHFEKYVTPIAPGVYNRVRAFDLYSQNFIFNFAFDPTEHMPVACCDLKFIPLFGIGVGVGANEVRNFIEYAAVSGVGSALLVGFPYTTAAFAWQVFGAFRIQPEDAHFSFDIGYRYNNNGRFKTSDSGMITAPGVTAAGVLSSVESLKGRLQTNCIYFALNVGW